MARILRDDVHGDIPLSSLDARVIDDALFQRLRGVRQSAGAHLVFPTMRVTRFEHSVGVMHLASEMLRGTLLNSRVATRAAVLDSIVELVAGLATFDRSMAQEGHDIPTPASLYSVVHDDSVTHGLSAAFDVVARTPGSKEQHSEWQVALAVCEQGLRLCALLHDVGHLPFSHDFELAVVEAIESGGDLSERRASGLRAYGLQLHEKVSLGLSSVLRDRIARAVGQTTNSAIAFDQAAFAMARQLLVAKTTADAASLATQPELAAKAVAHGTTAWLYSLIDGEVDADRADYILRDSAGYTLGSSVFDLSRFIHGLEVALDPATAIPETVVRGGGVSAVEGFFLARHRLYADAVYHHRIQKATACLRYALTHVIGQIEDAEVDSFFDAVSVLAEWSSLEHGNDPLSRVKPVDAEGLRRAAERFAAQDDSRMRFTIDRLLASTSGRPRTAWRSFTHREDGVKTLWKRGTEVPVDPGDLGSWRGAVGRSSLSGELVRELRHEGVLLGFADPKNWAADEEGGSQLKIDLAGASDAQAQLAPLSRHAPLFGALKDVSNQQLEVFTYAFEDVDSTAVAKRLFDDAISQPDPV